MSTTDPTTEGAIRTVARRIATLCIATAINNNVVSWEDHPEIGEHDWERVIADVRHLAERTDVQTEHYESAHRHLAGRAEGEA